MKTSPPIDKLTKIVSVFKNYTKVLSRLLEHNELIPVSTWKSHTSIEELPFGQRNHDEERDGKIVVWKRCEIDGGTVYKKRGEFFKKKLSWKIILFFRRTSSSSDPGHTEMFARVRTPQRERQVRTKQHCL